MSRLIFRIKKMVEKENSQQKIEDIILEFIKNRTKQEDATASRHIHRRFDIPIEEIEKILSNLENKQIIKKFYDEEYQEYRFRFIN